jgi:hypothetical protein
MELAIAIAANIVVGAILLALFAWRRASGGVSLTSPEEAMAMYRRQFPDITASATVASDGLAALLLLTGSRKIGLLHRQGLRWCARELLPEDLRSATVDGEALVIRLHDFGWPCSRVRIADPEVRGKWLLRLQELAASAANGHSRVQPHA